MQDVMKIFEKHFTYQQIVVGLGQWPFAENNDRTLHVIIWHDGDNT